MSVRRQPLEHPLLDKIKIRIVHEKIYGMDAEGNMTSPIAVQAFRLRLRR